MSTPQDPRNPQRQFVPQVNDERNNAGRFDLVERRKEEEQERIDSHKRAQARDLLRRTLGREPTADEIANALAR